MPATPTALTAIGPASSPAGPSFDEQGNDVTNGNKFDNNDRTKLYVRNTTVGAIVLNFYADLYGVETLILAVSIPGSGTEHGVKILGPFPSQDFNDHTTTASSTNGQVHCKAASGSSNDLMLCPYHENPTLH